MQFSSINNLSFNEHIFFHFENLEKYPFGIFCGFIAIDNEKQMTSHAYVFYQILKKYKKPRYI